MAGRKCDIMYGYIYETTNLINGMKYIGKHKSKEFDKNYYGSGTSLNRAITLYGKENFLVRVLEEIPDDKDYKYLAEREMFYINKYNAVKSNEFYNMSYGGENEGWLGVNEAAKDNQTLNYKMRFNWSNQAKGKIWIYKDNTRKYIKPEELNIYIQQGWIKGRPSEIISKGNKHRDWSSSKFIKRVKCLLKHNNIIKEFQSISDLYRYCKEEYDLSCGTVKMLLNTEQEFIPHYNRLQKAKGLKLKRLK